MQIPEDPFEINELYQKHIEYIATNTLKSKSKRELLDMKVVFVAFDECNKCSSAAPYLMMVEAELARKESAVGNMILLWSAIIAAIFAVIASWPIVKEWIPAFRHASKDANFQLQQTNSIPPEIEIKPAVTNKIGANHP